MLRMNIKDKVQANSNISKSNANMKINDKKGEETKHDAYLDEV